MPFQSIEPRRLYRQIADQIRALIRRGEFATGSRLPPERDLARQLGVSRPSVREALIALEVEGLVDVRIGSGIYVRAPDAAVATDAPEATAGPFELLRARYVIESECAALAAKSAKRAQVAAIGEALDEMDREMEEGRQPLPGDRLFHLRIRSHRQRRAVHVIAAWDSGPVRCSAAQAPTISPDLWKSAMSEHRAENRSPRDPDAARIAMQRHLNHAYCASKGWNERHDRERTHLRGPGDACLPHSRGDDRSRDAGHARRRRGRRLLRLGGAVSALDLH
jgi:DNA-binding FadR family transcriptional regulator